MRVTSQMMLSRYQSDVSDAYATLSKEFSHAYNYRRFDRPSDDPLAASQTFDIQWQMSLNDNYSSNITNINSALTTGEKILQNVDAILTQASGTTVLKAINGDMSAENRVELADQLLSIRDSIVSQMNTKYADSYLFSGSGAGKAPFELVKDASDPSKDKLYYRGVDVDTGLSKDGSTPAVSLEDLANEKVYADIGLGMTRDESGAIEDQSAYNKAMPGISYLGYGTNSDGVPNNLCSLLSQIAGILKNSANEQQLSTDELEQIKKLTDAFDASQDKFEAGQAQLGNRMQFLNITSDYITELKTNLAEKDNEVEFVEPTDAIETFYKQLLCYNAALKVGSQILQQSLIDYLK
jgi:flagellar hook-associated protein 3 FlgL